MAKTWGAGSGAGADGLWSTGANWDGDTVPAFAEVIIFDGTAVTNCNIDNVGTFTSGTFTVQTTYTGQITQNVAMTTGAFVMNGNNVSAYTQAANLATTSFAVTTGNITFGFTVSSGTFQCSTFTISSGYVDFSGVGICLTTGALAFSTAAGSPTVAITCPPGTWETRGGWSHAGTDLITFNAGAGTVAFTGSTTLSVNVPSITYNLCTITRTGGTMTISNGTTIPLGANPTTQTDALLTCTGTITVSGAWRHDGSLTVSVTTGTVSGALTALTIERNLTINNSGGWPASIPVAFIPTATTLTVNASGVTFGTCTVNSVAPQSFTVANGTTIPLGANPSTNVTTGTFTITGTVTVSGSWAHVGNLTVSVTTGVVSGALTAFTLNESLTIGSTGTWPASVVVTMTGTGNRLLDATTAVFGQVILNRTVDASTFTITAGTSVPLGTNPTVNLGAGAITWSGDFSATGTVAYTGGAITFGAGTVGTGTFVWKVLSATSFTLNAATTWPSTGGVWFDVTTANTRNLDGAGKTFASFMRTGANAALIQITGANTFGTFTDNDGLVAHSLTFPNATTTVGTFAVAGSVGKLVTLARTGAAGTFTLTKSTAGDVTQVAFISVSNSTVDVAPAWYAGATPPSVDGGGNTNWIFTAAPGGAKTRKQAILL